jgi:hypothetical protein
LLREEFGHPGRRIRVVGFMIEQCAMMNKNRSIVDTRREGPLRSPRRSARPFY